MDAGSDVNILMKKKEERKKGKEKKKKIGNERQRAHQQHTVPQSL